MTAVLGVDPGQHGGAALLVDGAVVACWAWGRMATTNGGA